MDLKQLSALLGISPTTISRALNGYPEVSEATRRRVEEAAEAHGYRPNHAARRLALGKADAVGIIYPPDIVELGDPGALGVVGALTEHFNAQGSDLVIVITGRKNELATYARLVQGRRVDALIVARTWVNDARVDYLLRRGFPFVAFGRTARCADHAWFDFDNTAGAAMAVARLAGFGHRRIAYIHAPLELNFAKQRFDGYRQGLRAAGLTETADWIVPSNFALGRRGGYLAMQQLLAQAQRPTAVVVDNSLACIGAMRALMDAGLQPGRDLSVIAQDFVSEADLLVMPSITSIEHADAQRVGAQLADLVIGVQQKRPLSALQVLWQPSIRPGDSDGPAPAA